MIKKNPSIVSIAIVILASSFLTAGLFQFLSQSTIFSPQTLLAQANIIPERNSPITEFNTLTTAQIENESPIGLPCGSGELLPEWIICLHGTVGEITPNGTPIPFDDILVTISYEGKSVNGTTFIHPGQSIPTYGIDISPLEPKFLEPVTVTAVLPHATIERQVIIFPNFSTQNQQANILIPSVAALEPAPLWGHVIDFHSEGAVEGAVVIAEHDGQTITATTQLTPDESDITYRFKNADLAAIGAFSGESITLTAVFDGDADQQTVVLTPEPIQLDFVTGWKCDEFDPLPRQTPGVGLPRQTPGVGLPDVACFWGYGLVDGVALEGVTIQLAITNTVYETEARLFPGETIPRYAIGAWGGSELEGEIVEGTAVYKGEIASTKFTASLNANLHQRTDIQVSSATIIQNFLNIDTVWGLQWHNGSIWAATEGGLVQWHDDGTYTQYTTQDGAPENEITTLDIDQENKIWIGTKESGIASFNPLNGEWEHYNSDNSPLNFNNIETIAVAPDNTIWIGTLKSLMQFNPETLEWRLHHDYEQGETILETVFHDITFDLTGGVWATSAEHGYLHYYDQINDEFISFQNIDSIFNNYEIKHVNFDANGDLWFFSDSPYTLSKYQFQSETLISYTPSDSDLNSDNINDFKIDQNGDIWIAYDRNTWTGGTTYLANDGGVGYFSPNTNQWVYYSQKITGLAHNDVTGITFDGNGKTIVGTQNGISQLNPSSNSWENLLQDPQSAPLNANIYDLGIYQDEEIIIGSVSGLSIYTIATNQWEHFDNTNSPILQTPIEQIHIIDNTIWLESSAGLVKYERDIDDWQIYDSDNSILNSNLIADFVIDDNNTVWIAQNDGLKSFNVTLNSWEKFTPNQYNFHSDNPETLAIDNQGVIWMGYRTGAVDYFNPETLETHTFDETNSTMIEGSTITKIAVDNNNNIWVGTDDNGLSFYNRATNSWHKYDSSNSILPNDYVMDLLIDTNGDLWIGMEYLDRTFDGGGVVQYRISTDEWIIHSVASLGITPSGARLQNDPSGDIWFLGDGFARYKLEPRQIDFDIEATGPAVAFPGETIEISSLIQNVGSQNGFGVLTATIPSSFIYQNATISPTTISPLSWDLGVIGIDDPTQFISFNVTIPSNATPGTLYTVSTLVDSTTTSESFVSNNYDEITIEIRDPYKSDVRVTMAGPPLLVPGNTAVFDLWIDNFGGINAENSELNVSLPPELTLLSAIPQPDTNLEWELGTVDAFSEPVHFSLTAIVNNDVPQDSELTITAQISTSTEEDSLSNNTAVVTTQTSLVNAETLILVAPSRLSEEFGASQILDKIYDVAAHPNVKGVVLDVTRDSDVAAAYENWDSQINSWQAANEVAREIKSLIDEYTIAFPNLSYLMIIGGDNIIPFYRVSDQNGTSWHERSYAAYVPESTEQAAISANKLLTDDFYADRNPTIPNSSFWADSHPLYLPDFANGRLVETPEEIISAIDAFLASDGSITINNHLIGTLPNLTNDLGETQCDIFSGSQFENLCTTNQIEFAEQALENPFDGLWNAPHANHFTLGQLSAEAISKSNRSYRETVWMTIGCHAGLNTTNVEHDILSHDLAQAILGQGGSYIASSAYTYASFLSTGYSEALALALSEELLYQDAIPLGVALMRAKQAYFASRSEWVDYTDEKVLIPMTLYGFPMLEVQVQSDNQRPLAFTQTVPYEATAVFDDSSTIVQYDFTNLESTLNHTSLGTYFDFEGETLTQEGTAVQPSYQTPVLQSLNGQTVRGVVVREAQYQTFANFDPVIAQSWALEAGTTPHFAERTPLFSGWDRQFPFTLGQFNGLEYDTYSLNLVLGRFDSLTQEETLFSDLKLDVIYSSSSDTQPPTVNSHHNFTDGNTHHLQIDATDASGIQEVTAVCDSGQGQWAVTTLEQEQGAWVGHCQGEDISYFVQIVDHAGNVTRSEWVSTNNGFNIFLPLIRQP